MSFRISSEASDDLVSIWKYTLENRGAEHADLYIDALMLRFVWLTGKAKLWRPRGDIKKGVFSCVEKSHVIFFSEGPEGIDILRVLHGRMDLAQHVE